MASVKAKFLVAGIYAAATALGLYGLSAPAREQLEQTVAEEQQIFNADDAQWFGDDPVVRQPLELLSILPGDEMPRANMAIDGQERLVEVGTQLLPPCLKVAEVMAESVLLDSCGAFRLLSLRGTQDDEGDDRFEYRSELADYDFAARASSVVDLRNDTQVRALIAEYLQRLYESPLSLRGSLDVQRRKTSAGRRHYYLYPGDDPRLFSQLPLKGGDRLHAINGMALAAPDVLNDLYDRLGSSRDITLTLDRDGEALVVLLSLPSRGKLAGLSQP